MADAYAVLGVEPAASEEEVRAAYRRLARIYHPDRHAEAEPHLRAEAERRMQELNLAYAAIRKGRGRNNVGETDRRARKTTTRSGPGFRPRDEFEREALFKRWEELELQAREEAERARHEALAKEAAEQAREERRKSEETTARAKEPVQDASEAAEAEIRRRVRQELELQAARERARQIREKMEAQAAQREADRRAWLEKIEEAHPTGLKRFLRLGKKPPDDRAPDSAAL